MSRRAVGLQNASAGNVQQHQSAGRPEADEQPISDAGGCRSDRADRRSGSLCLRDACDVDRRLRHGNVRLHCGTVRINRIHEIRVIG